MGIRRDLARAKKLRDLASPVVTEVVREDGVVREVRTAPLAPPPQVGSTADIPFTNAAEAPDAVVMRRKAAGRWQPVTAAAFAREVQATAKGLIAAGLAPGGRVALMARTRYEWAVLDFAIWAAGGLSVPVYATSSAEQVEWILRDSGAEFLVVETAEHARTARKAIAALPEGRPEPVVWRIDAGGDGGEHVSGGTGGRAAWRGALAELADLGRGIADAAVAARRADLGPQSPATLVYTSGTTGRPKGCVLTHANLHAETANLLALLRPVFEEISRQTPTTLIFLPLAHVLGRTLQIACVTARITLGHCPGVRPAELRPELASFRPTFLVGVPYLFEKIHGTGRAMAESIGRGASFERADRVGVAYGEALLRWYLRTGTGPGPGLRLRLARRLYELLVYRRIRAALGGRIRYAISGGSPLDRRLALFFLGCGVLIYEGYGLTETTSAATMMPPLAPRPGTVGHPVPGTAVRLAEDGEVLVRGGIVASRYWNGAQPAGQARTDGWFPTGDLGRLDEDGYLTITGRKRDVLITSGGKNVSPGLLEDRLRSRPPIGPCMVVGDGRPYVAALITLEPEAVAHWLSLRRRPVDTPFATLREDPDLRAAVQRAVDYANEAVSRAESIRRFALVEGEFTEDNGLLTPSLKVRRAAVAAVYAEQIERLYG